MPHCDASRRRSAQERRQCCGCRRGHGVRPRRGLAGRGKHRGRRVYCSPHGGQGLRARFSRGGSSGCLARHVPGPQRRPDERSVIGPLSAGVPGSVAGLWTIHRKLGLKPWRTILAPAIRLAEEGFEIDSDFAASVASGASASRDFPVGSFVFSGRKTTRKRPDLEEFRPGAHPGANCGPRADGFYKGETAELIVAEMERSGGIITRGDLEGYSAKWRTPVEFTYRGHRVCRCLRLRRAASRLP